MIIMKRDMDYALRALAALAHHGERASVSALAEQTGVPADFLRKIMQRLHQAGVVKSCQGASGGYQLSRNPPAITFQEVLEAMGGRIEVSGCVSQPETCPQAPTCLLRKRLLEPQRTLDRWLAQSTLADIVPSGPEAQVVSPLAS